MLWTIFEITVSLLESCIVMHFICAFLEHDFRTARGKTVYAAGVLIDFIAVTIINRVTSYEGIWGIIYMVIYSLYAVIFLDDTLKRKLFAAFIAVIVLLCSGAFVSGFVSMVSDGELSDIYEEKITNRFFSMILVQVILIFVYDLILKYSVSSLKKKEWNLVLSIMMISFLSLAFIHVTLININFDIYYVRFLMASEFGIIILNIVCFYMTYELSKSNIETEELRIRTQQDEYRIHYAENIRSQYEEIRRIRHDMKQDLTVISALYREGKYKEADRYADKISDSLTKLDTLIDVGNDFINAILKSKLSIAKERGIDVLCVASNNIGGVEDTDLCNLLGNILDNSIDAAEKCENGFIEISIDSDEDKIHIMAVNSIKNPVLENNAALISTKPNNKLHGYGIKTIRSIAEKYNGMVRFYEEDNVFCCQVLMYKQGQNEF